MLVKHCLTVRPLQPEEVLLLQSIMKTWCLEHGCEMNGKLAQDTAKVLINFYEAGVKDTGKLLKLIQPM